jgi:hypothetical protein
MGRKHEREKSSGKPMRIRRKIEENGSYGLTMWAEFNRRRTNWKEYGTKGVTMWAPFNRRTGRSTALRA